jgi:hypothetical protein
MALVGELQHGDIDRLGEFNEGEQQLKPARRVNSSKSIPTSSRNSAADALLSRLLIYFSQDLTLVTEELAGVTIVCDSPRVGYRSLGVRNIFARLSVGEFKRCDDRVRADAGLRS